MFIKIKNGKQNSTFNLINRKESSFSQKVCFQNIFSSELIVRKHLPYSSFSTCNLQLAALYNCIPIYGTKSRFTKTHREVVSTGQLKGFNSHHVIKVSIRACPLSNVFF